MRKLFWLIVFVGVYFWLVSSGRDEAVMEKGKALYHSFASWFEDTEIEFSFKKEKSSPKRTRRWD